MMKPIPAQFRAARALLGISQEELAKLAGVAHKTLTDFERGARKTNKSTLKLLQQALEAQGVEFIEINGRVGCIAPVRVVDAPKSL
jgi:transcriptional regulator with XRE-family HTH domain